MTNPLLTYQSGFLDSQARFAALQKSRLNEIEPEKLKQILRRFYPVFANKDFILYDKKRPWPWQRLRHRNGYYLSFLESLVDLVPASVSFFHDRAMDSSPGSHAVKLGYVGYLGDHLALTRLSNGLNCYVDTRDQSLTPSLLLDGVAHSYLVRYFESCVQPGNTVLDLGANNGYFSIVLCSKIGPQGKLIAFEANPKLAQLVFRNMELNRLRDRTVVVNKALADHCGPRVLNCFKKYQGSSTCGDLPEDYAGSFHDEIEPVKVEAITLDSYFGANPPRVDVIKLDIEGFEPQALRGAKKILAQQEPLLIFCEFNPECLKYCGNSPQEFLHELHAMGFNRQVLETSGKLSHRTDNEILQMCHETHVDLVLTRGREEVTPRL